MFHSARGPNDFAVTVGGAYLVGVSEDGTWYSKQSIQIL